MYTFLWRNSPPPALSVFDFPEPTSPCTRRSRANTPLQSLTLFNDPVFFECAQRLAGRALDRSEPRTVEPLTQMFMIALSRNPSPSERVRMEKLLKQARETYRKRPAEAQPTFLEKLLADRLPEEFFAWCAVARVILNLDEFITRE